MSEKLTLYGFNNLTKTLSFNIYDVCYAKTLREQRDYLAYIDEQYNSERLTSILVNLTKMIGASILNISKQDYDPQGASVNILIAEAAVPEEQIDESCNLGRQTPWRDAINRDLESCEARLMGVDPLPGRDEPSEEEKDLLTRDSGMPEPRTVHAHLDKSHVTVHTYPESHPSKAISTFRVDIDVSTCGTVTPLKTLDYLISSFDSDIITIDYRVRGFTRDTSGKKYFLDQPIRSIQDFIDPATLRDYDAMDINMYQANLFHSRLMIKDIDLQHYLFKRDTYEVPPRERLLIHDALQREMIDIYSGRNVYDE